MNVLIITSIVVIVTLAIGTGLATLFVRLSNMVVAEQTAAEKEKSGYNPAVTKGHKVPVEADFETQLKEARLLAAKKAAVTPRGANMRIGRLGAENQPTAFDGIDEDSVTTVRVAHFHGWNILRTGATTTGAQAAGAAQTGATRAAPTKRPEDLVPGKDYDHIQITDSMEAAEVRRARIANAKAKAAAVKALKASGAVAAGPAEGAAPAATAAPAPARQPQAAAPVAGGEPVEGVDYQVIAITDDMSPDAVRKARIANSKAKAAAFKAFKESGGAAAAPAPVVEAAPAAQPEAAAPAPAVQTVDVSAVPRPDFIEITDDMSPDDIRKARINNAKAKSAYVKALKQAGIDPTTVDMP